MEHLNPIISEKRVVEIAQELWDGAESPAVGSGAFIAKARARLEAAARRERVERAKTNLAEQPPATPAPTQPFAVVLWVFTF